MKILLFGKDGQLGWELQRALAPLGELVALGRDSTVLHANFEQPEKLAATVQAVRPQVIVNAAAYTDVDRAEAEPALARLVNAQAPAVLAHHAKLLGAWLVHYSSDYVFDGSGHHARSEDEATGPLNLYGHSKLEGEEAIRASGCQHLILRSSWVYAARGHNFARTIVKLAAERESLSVVNDQCGAPTGADLLADVSAHALRQVRKQPQQAGTYHVAASGETTWYGYARVVLDQVHSHTSSARTRTLHLQAVSSAEFASAALRPKNSRLDTRKLRQTFGLQLPPWQLGVQRCLRELLSPPEPQ